MLHISVRAQENAIIRNTFKNQVWGAEERHGGSPIQAHQSFEIAITAEHSMFRISVNSQHFCTFSHRLPLNLARFISIDGTCTISYITIDQNGAPSMQPSYPPIHHHPTYPTAPSFPGHHHHPGVTPTPPPMPPMAPPPYPGENSHKFLNLI